MNLNASTSKGQFHLEPHNPTMVPTAPWKWDSQSMPWTLPPYEGVMEFTSDNNMKDSYQKRIKRKLEVEDCGPIPAKQCITEERMTAHFNGLHISSDEVDVGYHGNLGNQAGASKGPKIVFPMSQKELEEKLKNGNRVKICEELSKLNNSSDFVIQNILRDHISKPCTALILWQPQTKLGDLMSPSTNKNNDSDEEDNNNSSSVDLNSYSNNTDAMDMDL